MTKETVEVFIDAEKISARVKEIASEINRDYEGKTVTLLGTLKGAVIFLADLAREIKLPVELEFIKVSSYGNNAESSGDVRLEYPEKTDLVGRHLIVVEDIVDMGYTASWLKKYLQGLNPASVKLCALLDKPDRRKVEDVKIDYLGFTIPDEFVVGYGLDFAQRYRNLPYVGILKNEVS
ncbi:MAG: hypoxanthine phosphoribosyltransferase [Defluviitaleaceae bacterium]|nr:hypoxanthine phosphoribosyltransferase [Defluviitaleaceae bacterium]